MLGPVAVVDGERTVNLGGPQQRRLLAVLLVEPGRTVHNERLLEVLWPDGEPESGLRTIRTYVSRLRTSLGDGYVRTTAVGYEIDLNGALVDAARFGELLETARQSRPLKALALLDEALTPGAVRHWASSEPSGGQPRSSANTRSCASMHSPSGSTRWRLAVGRPGRWPRSPASSASTRCTNRSSSA